MADVICTCTTSVQCFVDCCPECDVPPACVFCTGGGEPPATWLATFSGFTHCGVPFSLPSTTTCLPIVGEFLNCPSYFSFVAATGPFGPTTFRLLRNPADTAFEFDIFNPSIIDSPRESFFHGELTTIDCTGATFASVYSPGRCGTPATEFAIFGFTVAATIGTVTITPGCTPMMMRQEGEDLYLNTREFIKRRTGKRFRAARPQRPAPKRREFKLF